MATANNFELGLLPERKLNWRTLATSYGAEIILVLIFINLGLIWPERLQFTRDYHVTELIPLPSLQPPPPVIKAPPMHAKLLPAAPLMPMERPHMVVPREVRMERPQQREVAPPKVVTDQFSAPVLKVTSGGARMARLVRTGEFGSSVAPTVNKPIEKVQTGGFGDPEGVKGTGKENAKMTIAKLGSFDLPEGAGQGNGAGGAHGVKGTVASAGFGNGIAQPGEGDGRSNGRGHAVQTGGFGTQVAQAGGPVHLAESGPPTTPVEITYKPTPVYTQEARNLKLEGDVLLEVMFGANGQLQVLRVVRGLGHGLDESAVSAARQMRFKPALRKGSAVDSTAIVHVVFRLAY
ncbi:MAG TPA: energy transducer TonB [Terriglobales bacterium]|nr:energy transducer TonB [Terriglobales bacterium]